MLSLRWQVGLGKSKATAGLTFVCLSRAKRLGDLLIEPMPFERLSKLGEKHTFQLRLREEDIWPAQGWGLIAYNTHLMKGSIDRETV